MTLEQAVKDLEPIYRKVIPKFKTIGTGIGSNTLVVYSGYKELNGIRLADYYNFIVYIKYMGDIEPCDNIES